MIPYFVPTRFVWRFGGKQVHLCGSFTRWVETVPMVPVDGQAGAFAVLVHLPPGYHQYKFIVDGEWRHDETQPYMPDPLGNVNNWLYVRQPDAAGAVPIGIHLSTPQGSQAASSHPGSATPNASHSQRSPHASPGTHDAVASAQATMQGATPHQMGSSQHGGNSVLREVLQLGGGHQGSHGHVDPVPALPVQHSLLHQQLMSDNSNTEPPQDVDMTDCGTAVLSPITLTDNEPACTRKKVHDFLANHYAYELIPESGKVVVIDIEFSVRQAFHALHEQSISSAPLWDSKDMTIVGMISASDFIHTLKHLRLTVSAGSNPLSEAEMDAHTIRNMRHEAASHSEASKQLVYCNTSDTFHSVVKVLVEKRCSVAPILSCDPTGSDSIPSVLHIASISGVLACLMRHFRASFASLPLLSQPLGSMPIGTWSPSSPIGQQGHGLNSGQHSSMKVAPIHTVRPDTLLTTALSMLLEAGVSSLPVVDANGVLLDVYARGDITLLTKGNAYNRLQWEDLTVGQALTLSGPIKSQSTSQGDEHTATLTGPDQSQTSDVHVRAASKCTRLFVCTRQDALRLVLERLSMPAVRRVIVVHPETTEVEAIVSLSDVARYLFL